MEQERCKLILGDCMEKLKDIPDNSVDLIFADPPYNNIIDVKVQSLYNLLFKGFIKDFVKECCRVLKKTGSIYLIMNWREISYFFIALKQQGFIPRNWIVWKYYQGVGSKTVFTKKHEDILYFTKSEKYVFNTDKIRVDAISNLPKKLKSGKIWNPPEEGKKNCEDVWLDITRINAVSKERIGHPTQKPLKILNRIILASSNKNDLILDPMMGSGTTGVACLNFERKFIGIEINEDYFKIAEKRIKEVESQSKLVAFEQGITKQEGEQ